MLTIAFLSFLAACAPWAHALDPRNHVVIGMTLPLSDPLPLWAASHRIPRSQRPGVRRLGRWMRARGGAGDMIYTRYARQFRNFTQGILSAARGTAVTYCCWASAAVRSRVPRPLSTIRGSGIRPSDSNQALPSFSSAFTLDFLFPPHLHPPLLLVSLAFHPSLRLRRRFWTVSSYPSSLGPRPV
ncbi:hypothetical protein LXA43DRAFT_591916 [Ganoderma leucocontextum]|nr:hypothetical protein LXA43DRAFT_591916 [Ganoderma leucocontextum]